MQNIFKLSRKFVLLAVMLVGLGFFVFSDFGTNSAGAAPCCSDCFAEEEYCYTLPPGPEYDECMRWVRSCFRWCSFSC